MKPNASLAPWLTTAHGSGPSILRYMDSTAAAADRGGTTQVVEAEDLLNPNDWSWGAARAPLSGAALTANPTGSRQITISAVRTYSIAGGFPAGWNVTWTSPYVYTNQWGTANPNWTGYGAGQAGPYYLSPTDPSYLNFNGAGTDFYVGECVTTSQHNLKCGQIVTTGGSNSANFNISLNGTGGSTYTTNIPADTAFIVYPTGPNTFAFTYPSYQALTPTGLPGNISNVIWLGRPSIARSRWWFPTKSRSRLNFRRQSRRSGQDAPTGSISAPA